MTKVAITAIILAGGKGLRMGGIDKGLVTLQGKLLYEQVIEHIKHQVDHILISCNRNHDIYRMSGYKVFSDDFVGYLGPLSGIYSGLLRSQTEWNLIVSCDTPFLPADLVTRLVDCIENQQAAYVCDDEHLHPTILLIHKRLADKIKAYLERGERKLMFFLQEIGAIAVDFSDQKHCFINFNSQADFENDDNTVGS